MWGILVLTRGCAAAPPLTPDIPYILHACRCKTCVHTLRCCCSGLQWFPATTGDNCLRAKVEEATCFAFHSPWQPAPRVLTSKAIGSMSNRQPSAFAADTVQAKSGTVPNGVDPQAPTLLRGDPRCAAIVSSLFRLSGKHESLVYRSARLYHLQLSQCSSQNTALFRLCRLVP